MDKIQGFYKNKKVLITGHTGFKGSWLSIWLNQFGAKISGIALDPASEKDLFVLSGLKDKITDYRADIRNQERIENIFKKEEPEIVFHLAAQALVLPGYEDPVSTFETNIMGTVNILEACRKSKSVRQILVVTTDKVYENKEQATAYREGDPLGGYDPYSASKAGAEIVTQSYRRSFFNNVLNSGYNIAVSTARAGNVIGGGDWSLSRIVPDCIRSLEADSPVIVRNPHAIRPWQYVLDPIAGYLLLCYKMAGEGRKYSDAWNFGPESNSMVSVKELVETLISAWGTGTWNTFDGGGKLHEAGILCLNNNKSKDILGWQPVLELKEAIKWTVDWYKKYPERDVYRLCIEQIGNYSERWKLKNLK
jgi:CDP-glucose 4,6-dehydratase